MFITHYEEFVVLRAHTCCKFVLSRAKRRSLPERNAGLDAMIVLESYWRWCCVLAILTFTFFPLFPVFSSLQSTWFLSLTQTWKICTYTESRWSAIHVLEDGLSFKIMRLLFCFRHCTGFFKSPFLCEWSARSLPPSCFILRPDVTSA